ncbi:MAG TPA: PA14 domain-containing protein, partial [bacterium]|nr:PA14 domain-containing protein [bacterium]
SRTGGAGYVVSESLKKVTYEPSAATSSLAPGLRFAYYEGSFNKVADMERLEPAATGLMMGCQLKPREGVEAFGYVYDGYLLAPAEGIYTFYLLSNDGSKLYLNGKELIDNDGPHGAFEKSATLALKKGEYPIQVKYFQAGAAKALRVSWSGPKWTKQELTAETLFHQK